MIANKITEFLESYFPLHLQQPWDRCGIQVGNTNKEVKKVMIGLNADLETLQKAIDDNCDMLITHHPFLLEEIINLDYSNHHGLFIEKAIKHDILVYSLHTCLDQGKDGISMNDWLINLLGVHDVKCYDDIKVGKQGILNKPMMTSDFIEQIKDTYKLPVKYAGKETMITSVAICGGSGAGDVEQLAGKVDCYITGDCKHSNAKFAIDHDIVLVDITHHAEVIMETKVKELLEDLDITVVTANSSDYFIYK